MDGRRERKVKIKLLVKVWFNKGVVGGVAWLAGMFSEEVGVIKFALIGLECLRAF